MSSGTGPCQDRGNNYLPDPTEEEEECPCAFLELTGYYRCFVHWETLTDLIRKDLLDKVKWNNL